VQFDRKIGRADKGAILNLHLPAAVNPDISTQANVASKPGTAASSEPKHLYYREWNGGPGPAWGDLRN
jgi:hypothetical protein